MPLTLSQIDAELTATAAELGRRSLLGFTHFTWEDYSENWHHRIVAEKLDAVLAGKIRRLMIFLPPQNGKSELVSRRFPARALGKNPNLRILACSYNVTLAKDMSRDVQKIIDTPEYRTLYPNTRLAEGRDPEKRAQEQFEVVGARGYYKAAGVDGGVTGKTADIGIIDDPIKNREEAESEVYRERVWNFYKSAFMTRQFGNKGAIIICLTRWHEDDLAGRLLRLANENPDADQWDVVSLPAIFEGDRTPGDTRRVGEPLWPDKYPLDDLRRRRAGMGEYDWSALYQQKPSPSGGGLFQETWFAGKYVDESPVVARRARGWDTAGTENGGDWTVGVRIAEATKIDPVTGELTGAGIFYIEDVVAEQFGPYKVDLLIQATSERDGKDCAQREEKEGGSAGIAVIEARKKTLKGLNYEGVPISGSKVTRSKPFRVQCEAGNVYIVRAPWNARYMKILTGFPTGKHDDDVDASSAAFNAVLLEPVPQPEWVTF